MSTNNFLIMMALLITALLVIRLNANRRYSGMKKLFGNHVAVVITYYNRDRTESFRSPVAYVWDRLNWERVSGNFNIAPVEHAYRSLPQVLVQFASEAVGYITTVRVGDSFTFWLPSQSEQPESDARMAYFYLAQYTSRSGKSTDTVNVVLVRAPAWASPGELYQAGLS